MKNTMVVWMGGISAGEKIKGEKGKRMQRGKGKNSPPHLITQGAPLFLLLTLGASPPPHVKYLVL